MRRSEHFWAALLVVGTAGTAALFSRLVGVDLMGYERSPLSAVSLAVIVGLAVGRLLPPRIQDLRAATRPFSTTVLQWGVALLGLKLSLAAAADLGRQALPLVVSCIAIGLVVVTGIGRLLAMPRVLVTLIAVGTSICGISAIAATAPLIRARDAEVSYATAVITLFGLLALLAYPWLAHAALGRDPALAGMFLGTAVHDTSQVVGAAMAYEQQFGAHGTLEAATLTKLLRNLSMVIVIPLLAISHRRAPSDPSVEQRSGAPAPRPSLVPWFLYAFIALCALRSLVDATPAILGDDGRALWDGLVGAAGQVSEWCFMLALSAIGMQTNPASLREIGLRPMLLGFLAAFCAGAVSAAWIGIG